MKSGYEILNNINESIKKDGMWKQERIITTPQNAKIEAAEYWL